MFLISTLLFLPRLCNLLSRDRRRTSEEDRRNRLSFHSEEKHRAAREKRRAGEKRSRWTKGSRLLISNVSDYVGLGSLRFFIQTKEGVVERSGRGMWPGSLPRDCPICTSVVVRFVLLRSPRVSCRAILLFEALFAFYYFIPFRILSSSKSRMTTTLTWHISRNEFTIMFNFLGFECSWLSTLIFAVKQMPCVTDRAFRMVDSSETVPIGFH